MPVGRCVSYNFSVACRTVCVVGVELVLVKLIFRAASRVLSIHKQLNWAAALPLEFVCTDLLVSSFCRLSPAVNNGIHLATRKTD